MIKTFPRQSKWVGKTFTVIKGQWFTQGEKKARKEDWLTARIVRDDLESPFILIYRIEEGEDLYEYGTNKDGDNFYQWVESPKGPRI